MRLVFLVLAIAARHCLGWRAIAAVELAACYQTEDQIRSPFTFVYDEVIINCLSVTPYGSVDKVILSAFNSSSNATARFTLTCVASALVFLPSPLGASRSTVGAKCLEPCADAEKPCYEGKLSVQLAFYVMLMRPLHHSLTATQYNINQHTRSATGINHVMKL